MEVSVRIWGKILLLERVKSMWSKMSPIILPK